MFILFLSLKTTKVKSSTFVVNWKLLKDATQKYIQNVHVNKGFSTEGFQYSNFKKFISTFTCISLQNNNFWQPQLNGPEKRIYKMIHLQTQYFSIKYQQMLSIIPKRFHDVFHWRLLDIKSNILYQCSLLSNCIIFLKVLEDVGFL
jgi:hypothetical protein